jgi:hypothetical protein
VPKQPSAWNLCRSAVKGTNYLFFLEHIVGKSIFGLCSSINCLEDGEHGTVFDELFLDSKP